MFPKILIVVNKTELHTIDKAKLKCTLNTIPSAGINQHHPIHRVLKNFRPLSYLKGQLMYRISISSPTMRQGHSNGHFLKNWST